MRKKLIIGLVSAGLAFCLAAWSADFDGDGYDDIAIFRPSNGLWSIRNQGRYYCGGEGDIPVPGKYESTGHDSIAFYRPSNGLWTTRGGGVRVYIGGQPGDIPIGACAAGGGGSSPWTDQGSYIYYNNDVGIGTPGTPEARLDIGDNSTITSPQVLLWEYDNDYSRLNFENSASGGNFYALAAKPQTTTSSARMHVYYNQTGNIITFTGDGKVGIGMDNPYERLTVKMGGTQWSNPHFALEASSTSNRWDFTVGNSDRLYVGYNEGSILYLSTAGSLYMENGAGGYYNSSTHSWVNGSTRALKQDIAPNDIDVLSILDEVEVVKYRFKSEAAENGDSPYHIGFIAEDTPELLSGADRNGMVTGDCIGLLLAVVKEQRGQISELKGRITKLEESEQAERQVISNQ